MRVREMQIRTLMLPMLMASLLPQVVAAQANDISASGSTQVVSRDLTIPEGASAEDVVVIGGDLDVRGEITGDAAVFGGDLTLSETGVILGDAVVTGGTIINQGGRVRGEMRTIDGSGMDIAREIQRALGGVAATEEGERGREVTEREIRSEERREGRREFWGDPIRRGMGGIISTIALGLVLAGLGAALVFYARPYLETVSDTVRGSALRSGATGLAASFLVVPAFVVLIVALAVSIVGIPFLLVAVPLYPLAVFGAAVFGLLAVSHAIGERTAEQSRQPFDLRYRNSYAYLLTGLAMLLTPHLAGHLIQMTGFLSFIGTLLIIVTWAAIWVCATVGLGAVILSRAGTRRTFAPAPPRTDFDADDFFGDEPLRGEGNA